MARGKAEDAGGLTPAKDGNAAPYHFAPRTLPIFMCVDYMIRFSPGSGKRAAYRPPCPRARALRAWPSSPSCRARAAMLPAASRRAWGV